MGRGKALTECEMGKILAYHDLGLSGRAIAKKLGRSHHVIDRFLKKPDAYKSSAPTGRPKKLTGGEIDALQKAASNSTIGSRQLKKQLALDASYSTVYRAIVTSPDLKWTKMDKEPALKPHHIIERAKFADEHMTWSDEWKTIIWTDEKKFNLDGPDGLTRYWRDATQPPLIHRTRNFGGGSLMIWCGFSFDGPTSLARCTCKMNSSDYLDILEQHLLPFIRANPNVNYTLMQDNASIHKSKKTMEWLKQRNINTLPWPACSPDMNPIENVWGILVREVYGNGQQYANVADLEIAVRRAWLNVPQATFEKLALSLPKRINSLIKSGGQPIDY
ncbi:unnamed protein product, partial [Mesorhabditis spiculigera]